MFQIVKFIVMKVSLAFKRYVVIGRTLHEHTDKPFGQIPQIEEDESHLNHLPGMDALMVHQHRRDDRVVVAEEHAEEVDGGIVLPGQQIVSNDFHRGGCFSVQR